MAGWALTITIVTLLPKCPMCVAAWMGAYTGVGIRVTTTSYLRGGVIAAYMLALAAVAASSVVRRRERPWWRLARRQRHGAGPRYPAPRSGELHRARTGTVSGDRLDRNRVVLQTNKRADGPRSCGFPARRMSGPAQDSRKDDMILFCPQLFAALDIAGKPAVLDAPQNATVVRHTVCFGARRIGYALRHTWMNRMLIGGVDAFTVATLAGHRDPSMLAKHYAHLSQAPGYLSQQAMRAAG